MRLWAGFVEVKTRHARLQFGQEGVYTSGIHMTIYCTTLLTTRIRIAFDIKGARKLLDPGRGLAKKKR